MPDADSAPRLPAKTKVRVIEDSPQRVVLQVAGGGPRARGLGCFALFWNGFMVCFTPPWFFGMGQNGGRVMWAVIPFLGIFWAIGLGMLYWWARMRFTRLNILAEPGRVAVQKIFFKRANLEQTDLDADSSVDLVESYQENDTPVYAVAVSGTEDTVKFGTALSDADKRYLVRKLRQATRLEDAEETPAAVRTFPGNCESCGAPLPQPERGDIAAVCSHCGRSHTGEILVQTADDNDNSREFADLEPADLPTESLVTVDDSDPDRLAVRYPPFDPKWNGIAMIVAVVAGGFLSTFLLFPLNMIIPFFAGGAMLGIQVAASLLVLLVIPLAFVMSVRRSTVRVVLDRETLSGRCRLGPFPITHSAAVEDIERILVTTKLNDDDDLIRGSKRKTRRFGRNSPQCVVKTAGRSIPLTWAHDPVTVHQVAGLIRGRLRKMGHDV